MPTIAPTLPPSAVGSPSPATRTCAAAFGSGDTTLTLKVDGVDRTAIVHVPDGFAGSRVAAPVFIAYHGYGDTAAALQEHSGLGATADRSGFVAVFPQGLSDQWAYEGTPTLPEDEQADLAFFGALISRLRASGCIDMQRVYLAGSSNGGGEANALACRYASEVAAVMIVSGEIFVAPCVPERPVPVVFFHAFGDTTVLYGGGLVAGTSPSTPPIEDTAAAWATNNGCVGAPDRTGLPNKVVEISWTGCDGPVLLYRLPTAGHGWPGAATDGGSMVIDLNAVGWQFLSHFAR